MERKEASGESRRDSAPVAVESLTVRYGRATACNEISFSVARGAVYALLGRNGAGKSSLVRCLLGQQKPTSGRALLFGEDAWRQRARLMSRVGVVPEEPDAPPAMTAPGIRGLLPAPLFLVGCGRPSRARLERFGVPPNTPFGRLSKGQKGQVMLAAALGHAPRAPRPGRSDAGPGRRGAQGSLRGVDRRARRPRNDRVPHDARPRRCRRDRDARRDPEGRAPRAGRGDGDVEVAVPPHPLRQRPDRRAHGVRHGARRLRGRARQGPRLGRGRRRLQLRRLELRAVPPDRRRRGRRGLADVARGDLPRRGG